MPEELHTELKAALVYDKSSIADFFNRAAKEYLDKRNKQAKRLTKKDDALNKMI